MISEFALFVFTTLGGVGAGMYAASAVFPVRSKRENLLVSAIPLALLVVGAIALLLHLGHPERMFNAFANPSAGITLEAFASMAFGIVLVIDLILGLAKGSVPQALRIVGAIIGIALCVVMGVAYFKYESVMAWHSFSTISLFLFGSLAAGGLLLGAACKDSRAASGFASTGIALSVLAVVAFVLEGGELACIGYSAVPYVCAAIMAAIAAVVLAYSRKKEAAWTHWTTFVLMFAAVIVARYAFYSVL